MILQGNGPPDTSAYYQIAYVWVIVVYGAYTALLWWRARHARAALRVAREREAPAARVT